MKRRRYLPHHGRGGSHHIGRLRIKLAQIISESLGVICDPEDLHPAGGRARNRTSNYDIYAWEVYYWPLTMSAQAKRHTSSIKLWAGSFDTMTDCVKAGKVTLFKGEISC